MATGTKRSAPTRTLLPRLVRMARYDVRAGVPTETTGTPRHSIREFARLSGVSHTVITRIESGQVKKPSRDILGRIAYKGFREPTPLLYAAGYLTADEFRNALKPLFSDGGALKEEVREYATHPPLSLKEINRRLRSRTVTTAELNELAEAVFSISSEAPGLGDRMYSIYELGERSGDAASFGELADVWGYVDDTSRGRLLRYARALRDIADLEYQAREHAKSLDQTVEGQE